MKITLGQLVTAEAPFAKLVKEKKLPLKVKNSLSKWVPKIAHDVSFYHEQRNAALNEFGTPKAETDGKQLFAFATKEAAEQFNAKVRELNALEIDLPFEALSIDSLGDIELAEVTAEDLAQLGPLVTD